MTLLFADIVGFTELSSTMTASELVGVLNEVFTVFDQLVDRYDVWGDTVNLASRMESLGVPGRVQVSHAVRERLGERFEFEARGLVDVKGKGPLPTYFLLREQRGAQTGA